MPSQRSLDVAFHEIHRREFVPINVAKAFGGINLYAGAEALREFDLASRVHLVESGKTIHRLRQKATVERIDTPPVDSDLCIVTFSSGRVMADKDRPEQQLESLPFYLAKGRNRRAGAIFVFLNLLIRNSDSLSEVRL
jgi:hypothetical protein